MPYISSQVRYEVDLALRKGIETVLRIRFGPEGLKLMPEINEVYEEKNLAPILEALETAKHPEDVRHLWASQGAK